ncbi:polysaccharide pyruvyl transferase family protein [Marinococcus luteus]|uniref:polysaccharide pyruvyl transferase family protein n=1 Tax=Marinococcus luteus TaxID=1122204 RepID=UPI002ACCAB80|nr:polysaccharide pyruvyl transferase family protein [Marinococcus luteus]MDZ5782821.1 polysaccharide pyruvyl transferase family protein [Marinococcus luteus]
MISLHGAYDNENFGDELLVGIQAKWVQELDLKVGLPFASQVYRDQISSSEAVGEECLNKSEKLIYTGGGYFGEPNHKKYKWGINFFRKKHHVPGKNFKKNNKKYMIAGVGAGPVSNILTRTSIVNICNSAEKVLVRDEASFEYLKKYGVKNMEMKITGDVVLSLSEEDIPRKSIKEASNIIAKDKAKYFLGIHIGVAPGDSFYKDNIENVMKSILKVLENADIKPVLIADKRNSLPQEKAIDEMRKRLKEEPLIYRHENMWDTCAFLSQLDGVITTKLHVGITSFALGTKTFGIAAHQKTKRFYEQINKEKNFYELSQINEDISTSIREFIQEEYWDKDTLEVKQELKRKALENKQEVISFLNGN